MTDKKNPADKRISLAPLDFEQALGGILKAGPHVEDDASDAEDKEKALPKKRFQKDDEPSATP